MGNRLIIPVAGLVLVFAAGARAQQAASSAFAPAAVDFGLRITSVSGDEARFQRFRDLGDGAFLERLRFDRQGDGWFFEGGADHAGRRDQRYFAEYRANGTIRVSFQWDQVPLFISRDTRTLYTVDAPGVLRMSDATRSAIQSGQLRLADVVGQAQPFEVRSSRHTALLNVVYTPSRDVDVKLNVKTTTREGTMPFGATFGFSNAVEVPAPVDTRTTDLDAAVEWATQRAMLRVGYAASWFDNHVPALVWDNPWKATDLPAGTIPSRGRMALSPSNTLRSLSTAGSIKLPAHSRATANVTVGTWRQDEALLPYTINTAIPVTPLERATAEAEVRTVAVNSTFTSRPSPYVWLNARYRYYDFDNRTPPFAATGFVLLDQRVSTGREIEPISFTRQGVDLDASFTPTRFAALKVGYGREQVDRTHRIFATTTEDVVRASLDATGGWLTVRAVVERAARTGSGFDEEPLEEIGEQPAMRHYDIADRDRTRVTALVQVAPVPAVGVSASVAAGKDDYENSGFGLRDNQNRAYSVSLDLAPSDQVSAGASYAFERYTALQNSRNANPGVQFTDPTRNWSLDSADKVHTVTGNLDLVKLIPRTELRFAYNVSRSRATYVYGGPLLPQLAAFAQLPPVKNELQSGTADLRYFLTAKVALGLVYWYDRYRVDDFAMGPATINRLDLPGSLFLGYLYRPYTAHSAWLRVTYLW